MLLKQTDICCVIYEFFNSFHADQVPVSYQYLHESLGPTSYIRKVPLDPHKLEEDAKDPHHPLPTSVVTTTSHAKMIK